ncbi:ATP-binding protein [Streptomyces syringium]|uniref:ATP-binding protein n=1 Tax=Streptomyces syringium TaxID=76729 RepID=UPI0034164378
MSKNLACLPDGIRTASLEPTRANLNYSFGLPGGPYCLGMARTVVRRLLSEHGLADMAELGVLAASELLANACLFTPGRDVSLSVRWRYGVLRLTVFDEHPAHAADVGDACRARRRRALSTLDALVDACGGICGLAPAEGPLAGSRMWVVVPREAAALCARI